MWNSDLWEEWEGCSSSEYSGRADICKGSYALPKAMSNHETQGGILWVLCRNGDCWTQSRLFSLLLPPPPQQLPRCYYTVVPGEAICCCSSSLNHWLSQWHVVTMWRQQTSQTILFKPMVFNWPAAIANRYIGYWYQQGRQVSSCTLDMKLTRAQRCPWFHHCLLVICWRWIFPPTSSMRKLVLAKG